MESLLKKSLQDFRRSYPLHITFGLLQLFATSFIFVPLFTFLYHRIIRMVGTPSLINSDVMKIALSYQGFFILFVIGFIFVLLLFLQFGVMIVIAHETMMHQSITIVEAMYRTLRKMPQWFTLGIVPFMFLLLFLIPWIDNPMSGMVQQHVNLPIVLTSLASDRRLMFWLYMLFTLAIGYVLLRLIFTLHFMMIHHLPLKKAMFQSVVFTRSHQLRIVIALVFVHLFFMVATFLVAAILSTVPENFEHVTVRFFVESYFVPFFSVVSLLLTLLLIPLHVTVLTRMFHTVHGSARLQFGNRPLHKRKALDAKNVFHDRTVQYVRSGREGIFRFVRMVSSLERNAFQFFRKRKRLLLLLVFIYLTSMFFVTHAINDRIVYLKWNVKVIAHRGDWTAPENSLQAIRSAVEKGVDLIEIDVQMTRDGVLVLHHDDNLQKVAGISARVGELTMEQIAQLDIGLRFSETFAGERIPTLEQILQEFNGSGTVQVPLLIDLKPDVFGRDMVAPIIELIERYEMEQQVWIQSFDYRLLQQIRSMNPELKTGQVLFFAVGDISTLDVDFYTIRQSMLSEAFIRQAHQSEREVYVWTVNIEKNIREVLKYDIDGIVTDYPEKVQKLIGIGTETDE